MDPLDVYFRDLRGLPVPAPGETEALALATVRGDPAARARLIAANLRIVPVIARTFRGCGLDFEDLMGEGNLGLVLAARTFDPAAEVVFATWAGYMVRWQIIEALRRRAGTIRLPDYLGKRLALRVRHTRVAGRGMRPDLEEKARRARSLSAHAAAPELLEEVMASIPDAHAAPDEAAEAGDAIRDLRRRLGWLDDRQRTIITLRFGLDGDGPLTQAEIGRRLGLTRERVRQLEVLALRRLAGDRPSPAPAPRRRRCRGAATPTPTSGLLAGWVLEPNEGR